MAAAAAAQTVSAHLDRPRPSNAGTGVEDEPDAETLRWQPVMALPCRLTVDLPVPGFRIADFLALRAGSLVSTRWGVTRDIPLRVNGATVGWGELEGAGSHLAVRLTELA